MKRRGLLIPNVKKLYHLLPKKKSRRKNCSHAGRFGEKSENLKKLETALNTIQVSSVESERAFSAAGLFLTKLRCRTADATLDRRCFLKVYFRNKKKLDEE